MKEVVHYHRLLWVTVATAVLATAGNFSLWALGVAFGAVDPNFPLLRPALIAGASTVPPIVATALFALLGRFTHRPIRNFYLTSAIILLASLSGPLSAGVGSIPDAPVAPPPTVIFMMAMHFLEAAIVVLLLTTLAAKREGAGGPPPQPPGSTR